MKQPFRYKLATNCREFFAFSWTYVNSVWAAYAVLINNPWLKMGKQIINKALRKNIFVIWNSQWKNNLIFCVKIWGENGPNDLNILWWI